jgi:hypothetical protein
MAKVSGEFSEGSETPPPSPLPYSHSSEDLGATTSPSESSHALEKPEMPLGRRAELYDTDVTPDEEKVDFQIATGGRRRRRGRGSDLERGNRSKARRSNKTFNAEEGLNLQNRFDVFATDGSADDHRDSLSARSPPPITDAQKDSASSQTSDLETDGAEEVDIAALRKMAEEAELRAKVASQDLARLMRRQKRGAKRGSSLRSPLEEEGEKNGMGGRVETTSNGRKAIKITPAKNKGKKKTRPQGKDAEDLRGEYKITDFDFRRVDKGDNSSTPPPNPTSSPSAAGNSAGARVLRQTSPKVRPSPLRNLTSYFDRASPTPRDNPAISPSNRRSRRPEEDSGLGLGFDPIEDGKEADGPDQVLVAHRSVTYDSARRIRRRAGKANIPPPLPTSSSANTTTGPRPGPPPAKKQDPPSLHPEESGGSG